MSSSFSLTGKDTIQIGGRSLVDLADGDCMVVSYANDLVVVKQGKDGNTIYAVNANGNMADATVRVLRGSADDKALNALMAQQAADLSAFPLMTGYLVKRVGDGSGNVTRDTYILTGGVFSKAVAVTSNVEGNTEQSVSVYTFKFGNGSRALM